MKRITFCFLSVFICLLISCQKNVGAQTPNDMQRLIGTWVGTIQGDFYNADDDSVTVTITFKDDGSYTIQRSNEEGTGEFKYFISMGSGSPQLVSLSEGGAVIIPYYFSPDGMIFVRSVTLLSYGAQHRNYNVWFTKQPAL